MPRPKKTDKKPVEKPKKTAKRRKNKEEDANDLEEFEEKPEKKLKVDGQKEENVKAKVYILAYLDQTSPGDTYSGTHTFKDLTSALEFKDSLQERYGDSGNDGLEAYKLIWNGETPDGRYYILIKEITVDELLEGVDVKIRQGW